ncbi:MAG: ABC transporter substrate-binding protein [Clostridia bacterium]|nr:ABC transporter substrate-binding protein [Clostridia bacterium]
MKRFFWTIALLAVFLSVLTSCTDSKKTEQVSGIEENDDWKYGGSITLACVPVDTFNPLITDHASVSDFLSLIYEGLFECMPDHSVKPVLASEYKSNNDNTEYTIKLKNGVKFHSGKTLTSQDVIATLDYIFMYDGQYSSIKNTILLYQAVSNDTLIITLNYPVADFVNCLDFPILPAGLLGDDFVDNNVNFTPDGTGMYKYDRMDDFKNIYLKANTAWHNEKGAPYIEEVNIQILSDADTIISAFDAGVIDLVTTSWKSPAEFNLTSSIYNTYSTEQNRFSYVGINSACAEFDTLEERQWLSISVNNEQITDDIMIGNAVVANSPIREGVYFNQPKELSEKDAGTESTITAPDFSLDSDELGVVLLYNSDSKLKERIAQALEFQLENKGYRVTLDPQDFSSYKLKVLNCEYDLYLGEVNIDNCGNLEFMFGENRGGQNICSFYSEELSNSVSNLNRMNTKENRIVAWNNFEKYYLDNIFQIPLYFTNGCSYVNKGIYGELTPNLSKLLSGFENLYINEE